MAAAGEVAVARATANWAAEAVAVVTVLRCWKQMVQNHLKLRHRPTRQTHRRKNLHKRLCPQHRNQHHTQRTMPRMQQPRARKRKLPPKKKKQKKKRVPKRRANRPALRM